MFYILEEPQDCKITMNQFLLVILISAIEGERVAFVIQIIINKV
jgi:hypothetical protein